MRHREVPPANQACICCTCLICEAEFGPVPNCSIHPCASPSLREGRLWRSAALQARLVGMLRQILDGFVQSFPGNGTSRARIEIGKRLPECLVGGACPVVAGRRNLDRQRDDLVAGRLARHAASLQAQLAAPARLRGNPELHVPAQRRHRHGRTQRRFPRCHRQLDLDVAAVQLEARILAHVHFQQQVAGRTAVETGLALTAQPDGATRQDAGGDAHVQRTLAARIAQAQALRAPRISRVQVDFDGRADVLPAHRTALRAPCAAAEQRFEEIAETAALVVEIAELETARRLLPPARRRPEVVARTIAARAQVVVGRALLLVVQILVGLADGLEFLLGAGFLVLVGVILARELAVSRLDLVVARTLLHAQGLVVILKLHRLPRASKTPRRTAPPRASSHAVLPDRKDQTAAVRGLGETLIDQGFHPAPGSAARPSSTHGLYVLDGRSQIRACTELFGTSLYLTFASRRPPLAFRRAPSAAGRRALADPGWICPELPRVSRPAGNATRRS